MDQLIPRPAKSVGVIYTTDSEAIQFRMRAGFPGDVNRTHPVTIETVSMDPANPVAAFGLAGVIDSVTHLFRSMAAGDNGLTDIYGVLVRPFPFQQSSGTNFGAASIGAATPNTVAKADALRAGYMMVNCQNFAVNAPAKGDTVYVWVAASAGAHVQGGFEAAATGGSTIALPAPRCTWNGGADANGVAELILYP